ncbi:MAG TPA: Gfo/Idh/MocA family oxidoreductase [Fimbriimonadales bacterium]|nr:Gfo/Idh/MocA family oxidoreductase [Fimbriimonadales bacterium]
MKKLGIGIIGSGGIAQACLMPAFAELSDRCRILAIADPNPDNASKAAQKFEVPHVFSDFHELLRMQEIDAVCIATPNLFHKHAAVASFEAGKHVFCEKPMARNAEEAREMLLAQKKSGKLLQIGFQFRFSGAASFMHRYI